MERYVCIHGHFYQPPRENPWLESIELQESAHPFHDWNERITAECYTPNASARILDAEGRIARIVSNYERISFNFGPTLLSWLESHAPETYQAILEADLESQRRYSGHGSALAQVFNHLILPLANTRDKRTQIVWGISDFVHRFRRQPEGLWFAETAIDRESLEIAAEHGIRFTILAPHQAARIRPVGKSDWQDVTADRLPTGVPYLLKFPGGGEITVFFYHGAMSRAIAFECLLRNGEQFAERLLSGFAEAHDGPQLVHVATDGETYGHHHRFGDMALAYAIDHIDRGDRAQVTNCGEFLDRCPPAYEVEIAENTAWSCAHGVRRWHDDCGCNSGGRPGWNQRWRAPLREALDWLRDFVMPHFEQRAAELLRDPWTARDGYVSILLDRSDERIEAFLTEHAIRPLTCAEQTEVLKLMEIQRHAMLMYTSCGWFFDDISGIETIQILQYAGRVVQLAEDLFNLTVEERFVSLLEKAKSNVTLMKDGRRIYERFVKPAMVDLEMVAAHYALSSAFAGDDPPAQVACYEITPEDHRSSDQDDGWLTTGRASVRSLITRESSVMAYAALRRDGHQVWCGVQSGQGPEEYRKFAESLHMTLVRSGFSGVLELVQNRFKVTFDSFHALFRDEQRRILTDVLDTASREAEDVFRRLYREHLSMIQAAVDLKIPLPKTVRAAGELALNTELRRLIDATEPDPGQIQGLVDEIRRSKFDLDIPELHLPLKGMLERMIESLFEHPSDLARLRQTVLAVGLTTKLKRDIDLRRVQNYFYEMRLWIYPEIRNQGTQGENGEWLDQFIALGKALGVRVP